MDIGRAIRMCRTQRGIKQSALATKIDVSTSYISLIESGKREASINMLRDISIALGVPLEILVFLGSDSTELHGLNSELKSKLAETALTLLSENAPTTLV